MDTFRRNILLIILASIGIVAMLVSIVSYSWLFIKVTNTIEAAALTSEEVQLLSTKNAHTQTVRRVVRDTQIQREELGSYFITEETLASFLGDIEELGSYTGAAIDVQSVSLGDAIDKDELVAPLKLSLKSEGELQDIFYTLALLEVFPKALTIDRVRFTQNPDTLSWQGVFDIEVIKVEVEE